MVEPFDCENNSVSLITFAILPAKPSNLPAVVGEVVSDACELHIPRLHVPTAECAQLPPSNGFSPASFGQPVRMLPSGRSPVGRYCIERHEVDDWCAAFTTTAPGGGETLEAMLGRAKRWGDSQLSDAPVLVVAHAGWMLARRWCHDYADTPNTHLSWRQRGRCRLSLWVASRRARRQQWPCGAASRRTPAVRATGRHVVQPSGKWPESRAGVGSPPHRRGRTRTTCRS